MGADRRRQQRHRQAVKRAAKWKETLRSQRQLGLSGERKWLAAKALTGWFGALAPRSWAL